MAVEPGGLGEGGWTGGVCGGDEGGDRSNLSTVLKPENKRVRGYVYDYTSAND